MALTIFAWGFFCSLTMAQRWTIPFEGNTYVITGGQKVPDASSGITINKEGLCMSNSAKSTVCSFFYVNDAGTFDLYLSACGQGTIKVTGNKKRERLVKVASTGWKQIKVGRFKVEEPGYFRLDFEMLRQTEPEKIEIRNYMVDGLSQKPYFQSDSSDPYWACRGVSPYVLYQMPGIGAFDWFYNEVTVPSENDVLGSYYCAQQFNGGYFGFQNNESDKRVVLFSIWSSSDTNDEMDVPEARRVRLLAQGQGVQVNAFGGEGSGKQSSLAYMWKPGNTYRFLTHVRPDENGNTLYTAYFCDPEENKWRMITSFLRPYTSEYIKYVVSFLENFYPWNGYLSHEGRYGNVWIRSTSGQWYYMRNAKIGPVPDSSKNERLDYAGGVFQNTFFLKTGGYQNNGENMNVNLQVSKSVCPPDIDAGTLQQQEIIFKTN